MNEIDLLNDNLDATIFENSEIYSNCFNYNNLQSNEIYLKKYGKLYADFTNYYLLKTIKNIHNNIKTFNIVMVGCGYLYEVMAFLILYKELSLTQPINITVVDINIWPILQKTLNKIKKIINIHKIKNIKLKFIKNDFLDELNKEKYANYNMFVFSRCINPLEYEKYEKAQGISNYLDKIKTILNNHSGIFSFIQVVNGCNDKAFTFERSLFQLVKKYNSLIYQDKKITDQIELYSDYINHYLYIIKK